MPTLQLRLRLLTLCLGVWLHPVSGAEDLTGTCWVFSLGNPPQPFADSTWKVDRGAPGSAFRVVLQRGKESAQLEGAFDGRKVTISLDRAGSQGHYEGRLNEDGSKIEGLYSEARPTGELTQPFRLTRLESLSSSEPIRIDWKQQIDDPEAVICKASVASGKVLSYSWSLDGERLAGTTPEMRLNGLAPGTHRVTAIGFDDNTQFLTAPQTLTLEIRTPGSWGPSLLMLSLVMLGLVGVGWRRKGFPSAKVEVEVPVWETRSSRAGSVSRADSSILKLRGDGKDEKLIPIPENLISDAELCAPDSGPRLLLKKGATGVRVRSVYLGERLTEARLELRRGQEFNPFTITVEPIFLVVEVKFEKPGFATRRYTTRVTRLCDAIVGRITSAGRPVAFATCQASIRFDGGEWSVPAAGQSDAQGEFRFEMPRLLVRLLGVESPEFRLEKMDLPSQSSQSLEALCSAAAPKYGRAQALNMSAEAAAWLKSVADWVAKA